MRAPQPVESSPGHVQASHGIPLASGFPKGSMAMPRQSLDAQESCQVLFATWLQGLWDPGARSGNAALAVGGFGCFAGVLWMRAQHVSDRSKTPALESSIREEICCSKC